MRKLINTLFLVLVISKVMAQVVSPKVVVAGPRKGWDGSIKNLFAMHKSNISKDKIEISTDQYGKLLKKIELELRSKFSVGNTKIMEIALDNEEGIPYIVMTGTFSKTPIKIIGQIEKMSMSKMLMTKTFMIRCNGKCGADNTECKIVGVGFKKWCNCFERCFLQMKPVSSDLLADFLFAFP
jgi:hypothetical protein